MLLQKYLKPLKLLAVALFLLATMLPHSVYAQSASISPPMVMFTTEAGKTLSTDFTVKNQTNAATTFNTRFSNFTSDGETGSPKIIDDANFANGIQTWLKGASSISIGAGASKEYDLTITVPAGTKDGTYYGLVMFSDTANEFSATVGSLILVNVGTVTETIAIESLDVSGLGQSTTGDTDYIFKAKLKNIGTGYTVPQLKLIVRDSDKTIIKELELEKTGGILPGTTRVYEFDFTDNIDRTKSHTAELIAITTGSNETKELAFYTPPPVEEPTKKEEKDQSFLPFYMIGLLVSLLIAATIAAIVIPRYRKQKQAMQSSATPSAITPDQSAPGMPPAPTQQQPVSPPTPTEPSPPDPDKFV